MPHGLAILLRLGVALVLFSVSRMVAADAPEFGPPPEWVLPAEWKIPDAIRPNSHGQDFLLLDEQAHVALGESFTQRVYQIVTDAGLQGAGQLSFDFDPSYQSLVLHHVRVVRDSVASERLDPAKVQVFQQEKDLEWRLYNGRRSAHLILDDLRVGDIIDLAYTLRGRNPVFGGKFIDISWMEWGVPVRDLRYRMLVPEGRRIQSRIVGGDADALNVGKASTNGNEVTWRRENVAAVESEDRVPRWHYAYAFLDLSEFETWPEVAAWAVPLYTLDAQPGPLVTRVIDDLRSRGGSQEQLAVAALAFVQQEIRYLGIEMGAGSHRPSAPEEVLRRRFGDCKDKSLLLVAILRGLGIDSAPALVSSSRGEGAAKRLPSPYAFDHVIVAIDLDGTRHLVDPTLSYQRGATLLLRHVGRLGPYLRVAPDALGELEQAQKGPGDMDETTITHHFEVAALDKPASLKVTTRAEGLAANGLRSYFANNSITQISREYLNYYTRYYSNITLKAPVEHSDDPEKNVYLVTESYEIAELFSRIQDGEKLQAEFQPPSIWDHARVPNLTERRGPYAMSHPVRVNEHLTIAMHEDWTIDRDGDTVTDKAFSLKWAAYNPDPNTVRLEYTWESKADAVEPARLAEFSAKAAEARRQLGYFLTWTPTAAVTTPVDSSFPANWPMIALAVVVVVACGFFSFRLASSRAVSLALPPLLDGAIVPEEPAVLKPGKLEGLGGWLILVAFGLIVRPVMFVIALFEGRAAYFNSLVWERLTTPGGEFYASGFSVVAPIEMVVNIVLVAFSVLLLVLFFRRSHLFPICIQVFFILMLAVGVFGIWSAFHMGQGTEDVETYKPLMQAMIVCAIWIPYFRVSLRVKSTFTR